MNLVGECIEDKVNVLGFAALNGLLDNMVSVLVFDATRDIVLEFPDQSSLLVVEDVVECLFRSVSRSRTQSETDD